MCCDVLCLRVVAAVVLLTIPMTQHGTQCSTLVGTCCDVECGDEFVTQCGGGCCFDGVGGEEVDVDVPAKQQTTIATTQQRDSTRQRISTSMSSEHAALILVALALALPRCAMPPRSP